MQSCESANQALPPRSTRSKRGQEINRSAASDYSLMILRARFNPLRDLVASWLQLRHVKVSHRLGSDIQHARVRTVEFIRRTNQKITIHLAHTDDLMSGVMDSI